MVEILLRLKNAVFKNKYLTLFIIIYFIIRLINLTKLPIFNDEAIYLDWGFRETHRTGFLYYSLYDAKQPFLMWIFGIAESFISDPLFAGRLISVISGFLTLFGIYKLTKYFFEEKAALIAVAFYIVVPIFSFYDRQALMESSIAAVGIWSCFFLLKSLKEDSLKYAIFAGLTLGVGFFIKSSALVFVLSYPLLVLVYAAVSKKVKIINNLLITAGVFLFSISLLLINPQFWDTLPSNSRYSLTATEFFGFPFGQWFGSLFSNLQIAFFYITPLLFLAALTGIIFIFAKKDLLKKLFIFFFILSLTIATLLVRVPTTRYLISFLPFLVIPAAFAVLLTLNKNKIIGSIFMIVIFIVPLGFTLLQVLDPVSYLQLTGKYITYNEMNYLQGVTSGYAVNEAVDYFKSISLNKKIIIGIGENTGNPESAIISYFYKNPNVQAVYFDGRLFDSSIFAFDCLSSNVPLYFVAREDQLVGLDKYLEKIKTIKNPYGTNTIGIYALKKNCKGKTFKLQLQIT